MKPERPSGASSFGHWTEDPAFPDPAIPCMPVWRRRWPCSLRELLASHNSRAGPARCQGDVSFNGANGRSVWAPVLITRPGAATARHPILRSRLLPLTPARHHPRGSGEAGGALTAPAPASPILPWPLENYVHLGKLPTCPTLFPIYEALLPHRGMMRVE